MKVADRITQAWLEQSQLDTPTVGQLKRCMT
jgi:hypothetical protein